MNRLLAATALALALGAPAIAHAGGDPAYNAVADRVNAAIGGGCNIFQTTETELRDHGLWTLANSSMNDDEKLATIAATAHCGDAAGEKAATLLGVSLPEITAVAERTKAVHSPIIADNGVPAAITRLTPESFDEVARLTIRTPVKVHLKDGGLVDGFLTVANPSVIHIAMAQSGRTWQDYHATMDEPGWTIWRDDATLQSDERAKAMSAQIKAAENAANDASDYKICAEGDHKIAGMLNELRATIHGKNAYDTSILDTELFKRWQHVVGSLTMVGLEHIEIVKRGRTPDLTCEQVVQNAIAYIKGE